MKWRTIATAALAALVTAVMPPAVHATSEPPAPDTTTLATFGSGLASGSAMGPDGALYVTDPNAGSLLRVDVATGEVSTVADGLPPQTLGVGGAMDVAFVDDTAYVLVTAVGGDIVDGDHIGDATVGIHRAEGDGGFSEFADIGAWSIAHPPASDYFITTGVQYALDRYGPGFLVTDGHHNRVLQVGLDGAIEELIAFDNIVPTGLAAFGPVVMIAQAGRGGSGLPPVVRGRPARSVLCVVPRWNCPTAMLSASPATARNASAQPSGWADPTSVAESTVALPIGHSGTQGGLAM